jgi:hypothetical protein
VYSTCLFCQAPLGANRIVEHFPVGRRLAFDATHGRLWVVCLACGRWNLSPLEERWEAIEQCEDLFRSTRLRVSSEQIGLARHAEGTELIRIGRPQRPELAAWRYGDQLIRRRHRYLLLGGMATTLGVAASGMMAMAGMIGASFSVYSLAYNLWERRREGAMIHRLPPEDSPTGEELVIRRRDMHDARFIPAGDHDLALHVSHVRKNRKAEWWKYETYTNYAITLRGAEARSVLGRAMVHVNAQGATKGEVQRALRLLSDAPSAETYLRRMARSGLVLQTKTMQRHALSHDQALALEMALHEEAEQRALEGELALLERSWKEAEEIASIADSMALPPVIEQTLERWRWR